MKTLGKKLSPIQLGLVMVAIGLLLTGVAGCTAPPTTLIPPEPTEMLPTPATTPGWETYTSPNFSYTISHPTDMEGVNNGAYSWVLGIKPANPESAARNFIYVSVISADFQGDNPEIYNYNKPEADVLLNMQVGETKSLREDAMEGFTYTRKPDTTIGGQAAMTYENTQPWEFPVGTKEIRYYLKTDAYTYMVGGYIDTTGANLPGAMTEEFLNQIVGTFGVVK